MFVFLIGNQAATYAHGVLSEEVETGKIRFSYDDGSPMAHGYVSVIDKEGREIAAGQADADGLFDYSKHENAAGVSVSDIHGHHRTHTIEADRNAHPASPAHDHDRHSGGNTPVVIAVVAVLLAIAAIFYLGNGKKNGPPAE